MYYGCGCPLGKPLPKVTIRQSKEGEEDEVGGRKHTFLDSKS
jgi:hypothetical protein